MLVVGMFFAPLTLLGALLMIAEGDAGSALVFATVMASVLVVVALAALVAQWVLWR